MKIKKHIWTKYGTKAITCEIKLLDENKKKLDSFRFNTTDKNAQRSIGNILKGSYGISLQKISKEDEAKEVQRVIREELGM